MIGKTLGHYRILAKLGEGGMGVVYRARDTHLDRFAAIKTLPPDRVADPERKRRFVQEAKAASALNHPNIITIYDIDQAEGAHYIAMEHVEGKTLDQLIPRRGMRLNEALQVSVQIADALSAAHAAGIIHRDLKPANVMVTETGLVKILDFGLAKLTEPGEGSESGTTETQEPRTEEGTIVGTVTYMSPEQAEGGKVDSRSDVFSFGSVLYEMLTGRKAFQRESRLSTLTAILREEPKAAVQLNESLPPEIEPILARCLRKDPQRRWQNMSDLKVVLQDLKEESESGKLRAPQAAAGQSRRRAAPWIGAGLIVIVAAVFLWVFFPRRPGLPEYQLTRLTLDSGISMAPAASSDGTMFAFASDRAGGSSLDIWIQQMSGGQPLRLTTNPADDSFPSFAPDGSKIAFRSDRDGGGIYEIGTLGGQERLIARRGYFPRYSPDGAWISYIEIPATLDTRLVKTFLVPAKGGTQVPFQPEFSVVGIAASSGTVWSPDGKYLLFNGRRTDDPGSLDWWVAPAAGGAAVRTGAHRNLPLVPNWQCPYAWEGSHVYFSTGSTVEGVNLFRAPIEEGSWRISGPAERITSGPGMQYQASVLRDGRLLYASTNWIANIWTLQAQPDLGQVMGDPVPVSQDLMAKFSPSISRDGSKLAFDAFGGFQRPRFEVRLRDLGSGEERTFLKRATQLGLALQMSPDGSTLYYQDVIDGRPKTLIVTGNESVGREVCDACAILGFYTDPNFAIIREGAGRLMRANLATGGKTAILETVAGRIREPALSPDDRWIAFVLAKPDGRVAIYVAPLGPSPPPEKDWVLLFEEDHYLGSPAWSPDGNLLYYLSERESFCRVWIQRLDPRSKTPDGKTRIVYQAHQRRFNLNYPPGNGKLAVARDKLVFWMGEATGNIYMANPVTQ